jgi:hypothetical protein
MGLLARVLGPSGPTHGRLPCSFLLSPGDVVPMIPNLVSRNGDRGYPSLIDYSIQGLRGVNS